MRTNQGNLSFNRRNGGLSSISLIMPVWATAEHENFLTVDIPLFGIKTIAKDEESVPVAVSEAVSCFCILAEKFGQGLEKELAVLGWNLSKNSNDESLLTFSTDSENPVYDQIMQTGQPYANKALALA